MKSHQQTALQKGKTTYVLKSFCFKLTFSMFQDSSSEVNKEIYNYVNLKTGTSIRNKETIR